VRIAINLELAFLYSHKADNDGVRVMVIITLITITIIINFFFARNRWCRRGSFAPGASRLQERAAGASSLVCTGLYTLLLY